MRKFFVVFFLIFNIFLIRFYLYPINAQTIEESLERLNQIPQKCEIGDKCCNAAGLYLHIPSPNIPFPFDKVAELGAGAVNFILDNTFNKASGLLEKFLLSIFGIRQKTFCQVGSPSSDNPDNCYCQGENRVLNNLCVNIANEKERSECLRCVGNNIGVWTAIGCVYSDLDKFITEKVFGWGIGLAGIIALLCIIYSAFTLQTSGGNPEKIKKAQELLTSCIMGLMLIIFSVFILRLIGVDILKIPGFGK